MTRDKRIQKRAALRPSVVGSLCFLLVSCDPLPHLRSIDWGDIVPPTLLAQRIETDGTIHVTFDEPVEIVSGSVALEPGLAIADDPYYPESEDRTQVVFKIGGETTPGAPYSFEMAARDNAGNDLFVVLPFFGPNPYPARLIISEILTKSSTKNRDAVELAVLHGGNLGGLTLSIGLPDYFDSRFIFPSMTVSAGDYIIVHAKPEGIPEERDETADKTASGGKNASPNAWDFWMRDSTGLPDTNGIVTIAETALGPMLDAIFYSDKITETGKDYRSFGTAKLLERAESLAAAGSWVASGELIKVEDGARSTYATATRSIVRSTSLSDTDSPDDWHVGPTGSLSLGGPNTDDVHQP